MTTVPMDVSSTACFPVICATVSVVVNGPAAAGAALAFGLSGCDWTVRAVISATRRVATRGITL
jgi:hypothetical protein